MPEQTTQQLIEDVAREGAALVADVLKRRSIEDGDLALARLGATAISNYAKLYQANSAREATQVTIMVHSVSDGEEFRRLVMATLPGSPVALALKENGKTLTQPGLAK